jgi:molybdopterin converting factor small subunit
MERSRSLRDILGEKRIPLEAILAVKSDDKVVELDYHPRDEETIRLIPLVGGG